MKKQPIFLFLALVLFMLPVACNKEDSANVSSATTSKPQSNEMRFITPDEVKAALAGENVDDYVFLDLRKADDYASNHVDGFISTDLTAAKEGDLANGVKVLTEALAGTDLNTKKFVLMCYSGAKYAQVGTDLLINELKVKPENVLTIKGGMKNWK
ncbi:MAG: rhodanese-like domain-containing protein [Treponemataceae bacterium]